MRPLMMQAVRNGAAGLIVPAAPGVTPIDPLTLSPLASFDANRSVMKSQSNGTGVDTTVGGGVKWITDLSGNARTATQVAGGPPTLLNDATLSKKYIAYNQGGFMNLRSAAFTQAGAITAFCLFRPRSGTNPSGWAIDRYLFCEFDNYGILAAQAGVSPQVAMYSGTGYACHQNASLDAWHVGAFVFNGASSSEQIDNQTITTGNPGSVGIVGGVALGNGPAGTAADGVGHCGDFDFMQWHFFAGAMSAANIAGVKKFIGNDAGLSL